jgi:hypothetical protein
LIALERAWGFPGKGLLAAPGGEGGRPEVIKIFMKNARKWETKVVLEKTRIGPKGLEGSFSAQWWGWWQGMQPKERVVDDDGSLSTPGGLSADVWQDVAKTHGRNGLLLVVGCLLWWGDTAAASEQPLLRQDWTSAVEDVSWVLGETMKGVGALYVRTSSMTAVIELILRRAKRMAAEGKEDAKAEKERKKQSAETVKLRAPKRKASTEKENETEDGCRLAESGFLLGYVWN